MKKRVRIRHLSIFIKLVLTFGVAVVPMYIASFIINDSSRNSVRYEISQAMISKVNFYAMSFQNEVMRLVTLKKQYVVDNELKKLASIPEGMTDLEWTQAVLNLQSKLQAFKNSSLYVEEVSLYIPAINRIIYTNSFGDDRPVDDRDIWHSQPAGLFSYINNGLSLFEIYPETGNSKDPPSFVLEVRLSTKILKRTLSDIANSNEGGAILIDAGQQWHLANTHNEWIVPELQAFSAGLAPDSDRLGQDRLAINGKRYLISYEYMPFVDSTLYVFLPESSILGSLDKHRQWFWILSLLSVGSILLFSYRIYLVIHKPLRDLVQAFRKVERGHIEGVPAYKNEDEFGYLYIQFNTMMSRLKELIHEVYEQKIRSQRAELKQLQSQINPHFLYNSFFSLYQIIQWTDHEPAKRLVQYLGQYFRFITRSGSEDIPLEQEFDHAVTYMKIQSIRFDGHISMHYDPLPEACRRIPTPRLILQPILENACQYGVEDHSVHGEVRLSIRLEEEQLLIWMEDNGEKLDDAKLQTLQEQLIYTGEDRETTGMINVHRRLRLKYGDDYGLTLSRSVLGGLCVRMNIPLKERSVALCTDY